MSFWGDLQRLGFSTYGAYLRSPHWQDVKRRYRASELVQECFCGETDSLQLHHRTYARIGAERLEDLVALCPRCHALVHVLERRGELDLGLAGLCSSDRAATYATAERKRLNRADYDFRTRSRFWLECRRLLALQLLPAIHEALERELDVGPDLGAVNRRLDALEKRLPANEWIGTVDQRVPLAAIRLLGNSNGIDLSGDLRIVSRRVKSILRKLQYGRLGEAHPAEPKTLSPGRPLTG